MDENEMIEDLIRMLDDGMTQGTGHMNIQVDDGLLEGKSVETSSPADCSGIRIPMACSVPTLFEGLDDGDTLSSGRQEQRKIQTQSTRNI